MSWTNEVVLEFLELYRTEQILWDPKHTHHRNRSEIAEAWIRIQNSLSIRCTVVDLKKKKESLMTSFRMHLSKKKSQESYHTSWFAFPLMESFLSGKYECDSTNQLDHLFEQSEVVAPMVPTDNKTIFTHRTKQPTNQRCDNSFRVPEHSDITYAKRHMDEAVASLKRASSEKKDPDEYELYGQLLAKKLRKLDEHQRDIAMHEIDNIMFRAKMQSDARPSRSYSVSPVQRKVNSPVFISLGQQSQPQYDHMTVPYEDHTDENPP